MHGDLFEFARNYRFNARNALAPARDSLNRNQFGGTLGAPIVKNKLFFFGGYQGRIERSDPPTIDQLRADAGDAERRLHGHCVAGLQRRRAAHADRRICRQPDRSIASQPGVAQSPEARAGLDRSLRQASVRHPEQQHRTPGAGEGRLHDQPGTVILRALFLRGVRQPGDLRRHERPDAEPHGPEQPGPLAGRSDTIKSCRLRRSTRCTSRSTAR